MNRRTFLASLVFIASLSSSGETVPSQRIVVNLPSYNLQLLEDEKSVLSLPCRIGKKATPTPIGKGKILKKRDSIIFRYLSGPKRGQIINWSYLNPEDRTIRMPYEEMRGMDFEVNGQMTDPVIHSTTDYWTVGAAVSHGCIGLKIKDMLKLYNSCNDNPLPDFETTYQTMFLDEEKENVRVCYDVYSRGSNNIAGLTNTIGAAYPISDVARAQEKLVEINKELHAGNLKVTSDLRNGRNPGKNLSLLCQDVPLEEFI